jgi:hypothetical protein
LRFSQIEFGDLNSPLKLAPKLTTEKRSAGKRISFFILKMISSTQELQEELKN